MAFTDDRRTLHITPGLALSAVRIWEHIRHRQINPFRAITINSVTSTESFVDVVDCSLPWDSYPGLTLDQALNTPHTALTHRQDQALKSAMPTARVRQWMLDVKRLLREGLERKAARNTPERFLPHDNTSPLGVKDLRCALANWLAARSDAKALPQQWINRIHNLTRKGLKQGELEAAGLIELNAELWAGDMALMGSQASKELDYAPYRLSIIPVVNPATNHLLWQPAPNAQYIKRLKPKIKGKHPSTPQWYDPVMGYWVDLVEWNDLLGPAQGWMVFNHRGKPLVTRDHPYGLYDSPEDAKARANRNAAKVLPKLSATGNWARYRLTGGENYREWLVTLPHYPATYFSSHFAHRNVLLHVRCDQREGANGEKILFLQEVQSDWAQQARRQQQVLDEEDWVIPAPPWLKEWPALAPKLMVLHACEHGCDALAWTTGQYQVRRYNGLGERGLRELYDRTLPKEANRILKPFAIGCDKVDLFLPVNFFIEPTDTGYAVLDDDRNLVGTAATWRQAQKLIPDGAHETLGAMHGVRFEAAQRRAILGRGLFAWGLGL